MANRIKELDGTSIGAGGGGLVESIRPGSAVGSATAGSSSSAGTPDSVHITPNARLLTSLAQAVESAPDIDATRVATLQQDIASGQYGVDPDRIAGRLLQLEQDLGGTQQ